jgi:hypothetical protein
MVIINCIKTPLSGLVRSEKAVKRNIRLSILEQHVGEPLPYAAESIDYTINYLKSYAPAKLRKATNQEDDGGTLFYVDALVAEELELLGISTI